MIIATPGIGSINPARVDLTGAGSGGRIAIVLEESRSDLLGGWIRGNRYDVLLIESMRVLPEVPYLIGGGGAASIDVQELQTSKDANPEALAKLKSAIAGGGYSPALSDLGGSWVVVDFLAGGMPIIRSGSGLTAPGTPAHKVRNGADSPNDEPKTTPGIFQTMADAVGAAFAAGPLQDTDADPLPDDDADEILNEWEIPTALRARIDVPASAKALTDEDAESRTEAYKAGYRQAVWDVYLDGTDYTDTQLKQTENFPGFDMPSKEEYDLAAAEGDLSYEETKAQNEVEWGWWIDGYHVGAAKARTFRTAADTAETPADPEVETSPETSPADKADGSAVPANAKGAARYIEAGGTRIVLRSDGSVVIDARDGGGAIYVQAGGQGVKLLASGAEMTVGGGAKTVDVTADEHGVSGNMTAGGTVTAGGDVVAAGYKAGAIPGATAVAASMTVMVGTVPKLLTITTTGGLVTGLVLA